MILPCSVCARMHVCMHVCVERMCVHADVRAWMYVVSVYKCMSKCIYTCVTVLCAYACT